MSTEFYRLKKPFTSVRLKIEGGHTRLSLWVNHAKSGELVLRNEEVCDVLSTLIDDRCAILRTGIGNGKTALYYEDDNLDPETCLISEYGSITCEADLVKEPSHEESN